MNGTMLLLLLPLDDESLDVCAQEEFCWLLPVPLLLLLLSRVAAAVACSVVI
jgi:hypothetical protein